MEAREELPLNLGTARRSSTCILLPEAPSTRAGMVTRGGTAATRRRSSAKAVDAASLDALSHGGLVWGPASQDAEPTRSLSAQWMVQGDMHFDGYLSRSNSIFDRYASKDWIHR